MTRLAVAIVVVGTAAAVLAGIGTGMDASAFLIFALIVLTGWLSWVIARKSRGGAIEPTRCSNCGGLNSRHAAQCVHCGADLDSLEL